MTNNKRLTFTSTLTEVSREQLDPQEQSLIAEAQSAAERAYAPYSGFLVGASVLLESGKIFSANNQENVSFPVGTCAERLLLGFVHGNHPTDKPLKMGIAARRRLDPNTYAAVTPCGMCRQTISEYEVKFGTEICIYILTPHNTVLVAEGIKNFLPFKFEDLNR